MTKSEEESSLNRFVRRWFPDGATWTKATPGMLTAEDRRVILEEDQFGYCEAHRIVYKKAALISCLIPLMCCKCDSPDCKAEPKLRDLGPCNEW